MMDLSQSSVACGYSVLINTPAWLNEQAHNIRYEFIEGAKGQGTSGSNARIPLVNLITSNTEELEGKVLKSVEKIASAIHCFQVSYTGFGFSDASEAFRINVKNEEVLISLRDLLQGELQSCQLLSYTASEGFGSPDFTAVQSQDAVVSHEFTSWSSTNYFRVESVSILKKVAASGSWELLKEVPFGRA